MKLFLFLKRLHDALVHRIVMLTGGYEPKKRDSDAQIAASTTASTSVFQ